MDLYEQNQHTIYIQVVLIKKTHQDLMKNNSKTSFNRWVRKLELRENGGRKSGVKEREKKVEGVKEREEDFWLLKHICKITKDTLF